MAKTKAGLSLGGDGHWLDAPWGIAADMAGGAAGGQRRCVLLAAAAMECVVCAVGMGLRFFAGDRPCRIFLPSGGGIVHVAGMRSRILDEG